MEIIHTNNILTFKGEIHVKDKQINAAGNLKKLAIQHLKKNAIKIPSTKF